MALQCLHGWQKAMDQERTNEAPVRPMGRGRGTTLPAWMTHGGDADQEEQDGNSRKHDKHRRKEKKKHSRKRHRDDDDDRDRRHSKKHHRRREERKSRHDTVLTIVTETNLLVTRGIERSTVVVMDKVPVSAVIEMKEVKAVTTIGRRQGMIESQGDVVPATATTAIEDSMIERDITGNLENAAIVTTV